MNFCLARSNLQTLCRRRLRGSLPDSYLFLNPVTVTPREGAQKIWLLVSQSGPGDSVILADRRWLDSLIVPLPLLVIKLSLSVGL